MKCFVTLNGEKHQVRADYRIALEIIRVLTAKNLGFLPQARVRAALKIFYVSFDKLTDYNSAYAALCNFLDMGDSGENIRLIDFEKDKKYIQAAINISAGQPVRNLAFLHIEDYIGYLKERDPNSTISAIINIRYAIKKGKFAKLPSELKEFYYKNKAEVDLNDEVKSDIVELTIEEREKTLADWHSYIKCQGK